MPFIIGETTPIMAFVAIAAIHGISTALQDARAGPRGKGRFRGYNAIARNDHGTGLRAVLGGGCAGDHAAGKIQQSGGRCEVVSQAAIPHFGKYKSCNFAEIRRGASTVSRDNQSRKGAEVREVGRFPAMQSIFSSVARRQ